MSYRRCQDCGGICSAQSARCRTCAKIARTHVRPNKAAARKRAGRAVPLVSCAHCGSREKLSRHHRDIDNAPDHVVVLCWKCHAKEDRRLGKWGDGARAAPAAREHVYRANAVRSAVSAVLTRVGLASEADEIAGLVLEQLEAK